MEIRILNQQEILPALKLVWEVFVQDIASSYTPEGVAQFQKFIKYDSINEMYQRGEITFFGAFDEEEMKGTLAVKSSGHICLFFVKSECQGQGIGKMLFQEMYNYCVQKLRVNKITVSAAPGALTQYLHLGMRQTGEERIESGIRYIPMEMYANPGLVRPVGKKTKTPVIVALIIAGVVLLLAALIGGVVLIKGLYEKTARQIESGQIWEDDYDDWDELPDGDEGRGDKDEESEEDTLAGLQAVPEYIAENLPYEIKDDEYAYADSDKKNTVIEFNVKYPRIEGLEGKNTEQINAVIKNCAMQTVDKIYENPTDEVKEKVLAESSPILVSYVTYKVCYANADFISIAFEDVSYQGSYVDYHVNLRTLNINLKDGIVYNVRDIVKLNDEFLDEWLDEMQEEAENDMFLSELTKEEMKKALEGESSDGVYVANFFVDRDGIEIGYDLNYTQDDSHDLGYAWVTAPFDFDEIKDYRTDSAFWKSIQ